MLDRYQDMLDLPRPPSPSHAPMRCRDRAAQFAPLRRPDRLRRADPQGRVDAAQRLPL